MGVMHHHAVIANTWDVNVYLDVQEWVIDNVPRENLNLFIFKPSVANSRRSIAMLPDGSKEGWSKSEKCNRIREKFVNHLESYEYDDGSSPIDYVEVAFGERGQEVLDGNNEDKHQ